MTPDAPTLARWAARAAATADRMAAQHDQAGERWYRTIAQRWADKATK